MEDLKIIGTENIAFKSKDSIVNLVLHTIEKNKQVLVFNNSKSSSEATAERIAFSVSVGNIGRNERVELNELKEKILSAMPTPTKQCLRLAKCVERGIAFHHSGLVSKQRNLIEEAFKSGLIKVISSTPTLAAGLNLPAYKVIIKDYKRYSQVGFNDIPILEFHQMSGRAGRPGRESEGKAVLYVKDESELSRVVPKYIFGKPEEIFSKLAVEPTLKMYILSLVAMDMINSKDEIKEFFSNTLYGEQYNDLEGLFHNIFRILDILKKYGFINQDDNYYVATSLGKKVSELYLNPDTANLILENFHKIQKKLGSKYASKKDIFSLLQLLCSSYEMKPLFRVLKKEEEFFMQKAQESEGELLEEYDPFETDLKYFLNSLKTSYIFIDWIEEAPEEYLTEKYSITPGELHYKLEVIDWLLYCIEEFSIQKKEFYLKNYFNKLRIRFKFGVKEEILSLISLKGIGRIRARKLYSNGFKKISDLESSSFEELSRIIGEKMAISVKKQIVGENYSFDSSDELKNVEKFKRNEKPKEIRVREVTNEEIEELITDSNEFETQKKKAEEYQKGLSEYF